MSQLQALLGQAAGGAAPAAEPETASSDAMGGMDLSALFGGAAAPQAPAPAEEDEGAISPDVEKDMLMKLLGKM